MNPADIQRLNEKPTEPQGDSDEMIVFDYKARVKALQDIQSDTEIVRDPDLKQAVLIGRAFLAKWKDAWIADDPDREPLFQRWARESKEIKEDGRPRGAAHIENERFWDLPDDQLHYIIKDASEAINANPTARKATQGPGNWSDQVNDAATVLTYRKNKRLKADEGTNEGFDIEKYEGVVSDDIWFTGHKGDETPGELTYTANLDHDTGRYIVDPTSLDGNIDVSGSNPGQLTDDMVGDVIDAEHDEYLEIAQEHADEHANERDSKYAQGESISSAVNTMRDRFNDYEQDPSDRWEQYEKYSNQRKQISQRAKDLTEIQETTQKVKVGPNLLLVDSRTLDHIATHNEIGIGSVFAKGVDVTKVWNQLKFGGEGGAYTVPVPNAGYNLVLPIDKAKALPDAQETSVEKDERGTKIEVPAIKTSAPLAKFATDQVTFIIRPSNPDFLEPDLKQDPEIMSAIENGTAFSLLTAFPGDPNIPPASQWNGQFAVILPS